METSQHQQHHSLRFYQAQYQPSFTDDQAKVDDYLALGADALNTPNIDPDFFSEGNLFVSVNEKVHLKSAKVDPLLGSEDPYNVGCSTFSADLSGANSLASSSQYANLNHLQLNSSNLSSSLGSSSSSSSYSPNQQHNLEISSQIININSPDMMLSSASSSASPANKSSNSNSSYNIDSNSYLGNIEDDPAFYSQVAEYEQLAFYGSPDGCLTTNSAPNSRSSSISSGSGAETAVSSYEYLLTDVLSSDNLNSLSSSNNSSNSIVNSSRLPPSPASINSHYSNDSGSSKTFTNLDAVQHQQNQLQLQQQQQQQLLGHNGLISIKQEPIDTTLYQPTVIEEFESGNGQSNQIYLSTDAYSTINTADLVNSQYYCAQPSQQQQYSSQLPSTVLQMQQQQSQMSHFQPKSCTGKQMTARKRNAAAAFSGAASSASNSSASTSATFSAPKTAATTSSSKKPRMTKREKQKMMESDIGKFETENRDLRQSIDLLERQIAFCKRFLSENVAPVIQRQQQNSSTGSYSSPMMIAVSEM